MIIAATGHRPDKLGGYSEPVRTVLYEFAIKEINLIRPEPTRLISGLAQGWDQAVAAAAYFLNIPFIAAVPFSGQEKLWPHDAQVMYKSLLRKAERVEIVSPDGYVAWKNFKRNEWMIDQCDSVLALWNGDVRHGGTAQCVQYAFKKGKPVNNLWARWMHE